MPPNSPSKLIDDIAEIMKKEQKEQSDSMFEMDTSSANSTAAPKRMPVGATGVPPKKAKKSLESSWETTDLPYVIETPVCNRFNEIIYMLYILFRI